MTDRDTVGEAPSQDGPPRRWLDGGDGASRGAVELLRQGAALPPTMPAAVRTASGLQVAKLAAGSALGYSLGTKLLIAVATLTVGGVGTFAAHELVDRRAAPDVGAASAPSHGTGRAGKPDTEAMAPAIPTATATSASTSEDEDRPAASPTAGLPTAATVDSRAAPATESRRAVDGWGVVGARATATPADETTARLAREAALLERARASLANHPAEALAQADQHARQMPDGQLAIERELIAVDALMRLGRTDQARARARRAAERDPANMYRSRFEQLLAGATARSPD